MKSSSPIQLLLQAALDRLDRHLGVRLAHVVAPCLLASMIGCFAVVLEPVLTHRSRQTHLIKNLILAWLPLGFAWLSFRRAQAGHFRDWWFGTCTVAWLLLLPNSPYLFTDLVHLLGRYNNHYWSDLVKVLLFATTGMGVGMISLQLMHGLVTRWRGWLAGWTFVAIISVLCSIGVGLGRFKRWNSWDALRTPKLVLRDVIDYIQHPGSSNHPTGFLVLMALFLFCSYLTFYALRHAPPIETPPTEQPPIPKG
ncbi:MAG: DUF1361 domain-containing protein [Verrucomicrobiales bacterium]|nr:DUF1361 domain-containing protein [Verrucomicrobiales bacterium]